MKLHAARVVLAALDQTAGAPSWFLLFKEGTNQLEGEGSFLVDEEAFEAVAAYFAKRGNDLVIDYEHATVEGAKAPAAGWIKELRWTPGKGIEARTEWIEEAGNYIAKGEYRYFSPVFFVRKSDGRVTGVHSVALTNAPKINHLTPILAKLGPAEEENMEFLKKLIAKLNLKAEATEDEALAAVEALAAKAAKPEVKEVVAKEVLEALQISEGNVSTVVASIHALRQAGKGAVSREEFDRLQGELRKRDATEVVAKAVAEGKITPDQRAWADAYAERDIEGFKTFVAKAPVVIPVRPLADLTGKQGEVIDEAVLNVAKLMGVTEEDIKKYGGLTEKS